jgi:hypothetical protein
MSAVESLCNNLFSSYLAQSFSCSSQKDEMNFIAGTIDKPHHRTAQRSIICVSGSSRHPIATRLKAQHSFRVPRLF